MLPGGGRMEIDMNIYDIAKLSGVSIATVSRVVNGSPKVSGQTKELSLIHILLTAREVGLQLLVAMGSCPETPSKPFLF